jgi:nucleoside-diphosphate-sugar epimerase
MAMSHRPRFLVTGAGGFIGGWVAETLWLQDEVDVRAGVHKWSGAARLARFPMEIVPCDVLVGRELAKAMEGAACVVNCAKGADEDILRETRNVLEVASAQGVGHLVHISTTEVYGDVSGEIDEAAPLRSKGTPYSEAKIRAEEACWEFSARGLPLTVIRPPIVYGPFGGTWTVNIAMKLLSGNWGMFEVLGDGVCNLVYISDVINAILLAAGNEKAVGMAFNVNGAEEVTWNQYFERFNAKLDLPHLRTMGRREATLRGNVAEPLRNAAKVARDRFERPMRQVAESVEIAKRLMKSVESTVKTAPRASDFRLFAGDAVYVAKRARDVLGFVPVVDIDMGLEMSVRWLDQVGLTSEISKARLTA